MRAPGAGGSWTAITPNTDLVFEEDLNQLQWLQVNLPLLSVAEEALVVEGNDIRALAGGTERWYGQIRRVNEDPYFLTWEVRALGKEVLARDRNWTSRREWINLPPEVIVDEVLGNVMDEELRAGLVLFYDMETLTDAGLMKDLSPTGNDGTIDGATSIVGKWGLARNFNGTSDDIFAPTHASLNFGTATDFSVSVFIQTTTLPAAPKGLIGKQATFSTTSPGWQLVIEDVGGDAQLRWIVSDGTNFISNYFGTGLDDGLFHHIEITNDRDGNAVHYVDGVPLLTVSLSAIGDVDNASSVRIGERRPAANFFEGIVDHPILAAKVHSAAQVLAVSGRSIYEGGLLADTFDQISFRAEEDTRLNIVDGVAKAIGADWYSDRDGDDRDRFRLVARRGSPTATDTFALGTSVVGIEQEELRDTVRNDITALGYGDGQNQLRSRIWHATTIRDVLTTDYTATSTGPMSIGDTTSWPANGVVRLGEERIQYTGKTATQLGTTSVTRAYTADGYESLDAYLHKSGAAAWLHADTTTTPDTTYDPSSPQSGSSIQVNGHKQGEPAVDRGIIDQNTLDRLAQRLLESYRDPRDSVFLKVAEEDIAARIGDDVDLEDSAAAPLFSSPYRLFDLRFRRADSLWDLELGSPRDVREAELARLREEMRLFRSYGQGATNEFVVPAFDNIKGATTPPGIPLTVVFETPVDAKAVNEVRVLTLAMQPFRSYVGSPDIARTESVLSTGSHSHGYNRPSHQHGAAPTLDIPDATTTSDGSPLHTHPVTYVAHAVAQHVAEDPAAQQTNPTGDGVGHNHGGNVGAHSHGAPAAGSASATIEPRSGVDLAVPDEDITVDDWGTAPLWSKIDEGVPGDDATTSIATAGGSGSTFECEVGLQDLADPLSSVNHDMNIRYRTDDPLTDGHTVSFRLYQGGTLIRSVSLNGDTGNVWTTLLTTLTGGQADSITDYTDFRLRLRHSTPGTVASIEVTAADFSVPGHDHSVSNDNHTHGASDATDLGDPTSGNSAVGGSHTHSLDPDGANHLHGEPSDGAFTGTMDTVLGHTHTWTGAAHDHGNLANFNEPSLTTDAEDDSFHDHSMQGHAHVAGIFLTPYLSPSVGLRIDGTDRTTALGGPWTVDQVDIDITEYVRALGTHTLEFFEQADGKLGRLFTSTLVKFFLQSGVGG